MAKDKKEDVEGVDSDGEHWAISQKELDERKRRHER